MVADSQCPDENTLLAWALGYSSPQEKERVARHVDECPSCQLAFAGVVDSQRTMKGGAGTPSPIHHAPGAVLLDKYEVEEVLGEGGMGVVLKAWHRGLNEHVALKFIKPEHAGKQDVISRFAREARAASKLRSPHCCRIMDFGTLPDGAPFMVMEYLEGESLDARLRRTGALSVEEALRWTAETLEGLAEAHGFGIVHRDIKPANLFLQRTTQGERLKILDFGIAKSAHPDIELGLQQTSHAMLVGSPAYMAPEQFTVGAAVDVRTDIWAVGCTLFTLLTGTPPFVDGDFAALSSKVREQPAPPLPHIPQRVMAFIHRCLEKQPKARFQSVGEMQQALQELQASPRSHTALWLAGAPVLVILCLLAVLWFRWNPPPETTPAATSETAVSVPIQTTEGPDALENQPNQPAQVEPLDEAPQRLAEEPTRVAKPLKQKAKVTVPAAVSAPADAGMADDVFGERL